MYQNKTPMLNKMKSRFSAGLNKMKSRYSAEKKLLTLISFMIYGVCEGQNLVPNGDFEQYWHCPDNVSQIDSVKFWFNPTWGTPDYYNQCGIGSANVPNTWLGFQHAQNGVAFTGIINWYQSSNVREYIEVPLDSSLSTNTCYHFEMYINLADECIFSSYNIGAYLSDTIVSGIHNYHTIPFASQIANTIGNNPDTLNWTLISGDFTSHGGESYLIIGNFNDDLSTDTMRINNI
jgi:hypothetical protein